MIAHRSFFIPLWISLALAMSAGAGAGAVTVEQIPSPRPAGWVVDLTGTLPIQTVTELNRLGDDVKARTGAELAVVVIPTTGGEDPHAFATRLFNTWGIGERDKDNGVLVFTALDDHAAEIILGDGVADEAKVRESEAIMQGEMVPRFREGNPAGAIWNGAQACAGRILGAAPAVETPAVEVPSPAPQTFQPEPLTAPQPVSYEPPPAPTRGFNPGLLFMGGIVGVFLGLVAFHFLPVRCPRCREKMTMLGEAADDAHLQPSEKVEERIGSVDHQIWVCPACGEMKKRKSTFFSKYKRCPECSARTLDSSSWTIEEATYDQDGRVKVQDRCVNCSYSYSYIYATPRLVRSRYDDDDDYRSSSSSFLSSSSSSSSSGWSSSSGSSSSSNSSSSGSDFSGGSSSGGGASGRW